MYALTAKGMRYMDDFTINAGIQSQVLMETAAKGVVDEIVKRFPDKSTAILVLCGMGNNGGDAVCVARWLLHLKYNVRLHFIGDSEKCSEEFRRQLQIFVNAYPDEEITGLKISGDMTALQSDYDVIVDGIFGIGLNKKLSYTYTKVIEYINSKDAYKIAIDIPSGLHASSGESLEIVFNADLTVTFGNYKTGMFFEDGRKACGEIVIVDIGLLDAAYKNISNKLKVCDDAFFDATVDKALIARSEQSHKGDFGTVGIVVSSDGMLGASMLATKAAYRTGCGLVKIFCPSKYTGFFNVSIPEAVVEPYRTDDVVGALDEFLKTVSVVLIGPGLTEDSIGRLLVKQILLGKTPAVFDGGALNIISKNLKLFKKRRCQCVITPHMGEMARLCGQDINIVKENRIAYTKKFSEKFSVSMVVKSDVSIVSLINNKGTQKLFINIMGNSGLATAGSGDVQAGVIASLIAQGNNMNNSLLYGTMIHGRAAERYGSDDDSRRKMMAGDIIDNLF